MNETLKNEELGIEAVIMEAGNAQQTHKVVLRDVDANETIAVIFGSYEQVVKRAQEFVKG